MGSYDDVDDLGGVPDPEVPSPATSLSPLTDQPAAMAAEYAVVNKPKKSAAAPAASNGKHPDATYAVVNKTKKSALPDVAAKPKPKPNVKPKKGKGKKDGKDNAGLFLLCISVQNIQYLLKLYF